MSRKSGVTHSSRLDAIIEVVLLDVVVMLVRDTVLLVKVVDTAPPDTGGLISMVELVVVEEFFRGCQVGGRRIIVGCRS